MPPPLSRGSLLSSVVARDAAGRVRYAVVPARPTVAPHALAEAIAWLCRSHDATRRQGSSKGYSLLHGWLPAYPETTGYVLEVLLWQAERAGGDDELVQRARQMGDWEVELQEPDGGIMEGHAATVPRRSIVFNTGQVLHGWVTLTESGHPGYETAAERAAEFLTDRLRPDGTWDPAAEYSGMPHTYNSRVAWAMLRYARLAGAPDVEAAARRQLHWTVDQQRSNGWFEQCIFRPGMTPSTHGIAYTLRGLLESFVLDGEHRWLQAVERTSEVLIRKLEVHPLLPANFDGEWRAAASHTCLTGTAQLGGVWLRLYRVTGDPRWLNAGLKAVEQAARFQRTHGRPATRGAIAGSFPVWGRYAPLQYPNWATRFLAESLMLRADALAKVAG